MNDCDRLIKFLDISEISYDLARDADGGQIVIKNPDSFEGNEKSITFFFKQDLQFDNIFVVNESKYSSTPTFEINRDKALKEGDDK